MVCAHHKNVTERLGENQQAFVEFCILFVCVFEYKAGSSPSQRRTNAQAEILTAPEIKFPDNLATSVRTVNTVNCLQDASHV